jgi:hypothetical protein
MMMPYKLIILVFLGLAVLLTASRQIFQDTISQYNNKPVLILSWSGTELVVLRNTEISSECIDARDIPAEYTPLFFEKTPINSANFDMLITIPGIGPKIAERILLQKKSLGHFTTAGELLAIKGIGEKKLFALQEHLSFE